MMSRNMRGKVKTYFDILAFIRDNGPKAANEIIEHLSISDSTFYNDIKNLIEIGWAKKLNDNRYAFYDYREYETEIIKAAKKIYEDREIPKFFNKNFKMTVAIMIHADIGNQNFLEAFDNAMKKLNMVPAPVP